MKLTEDQLLDIRRQIVMSNISIPTLADDLFDHLVCDVEEKLFQKIPFDLALKTAVSQLSPGGLFELQQETISLMNSNKLLPMKKITYLTGAVTSMAMAAGWCMSILHLPGAGSFTSTGLASYGFAAFVLLFLPMVVVTRFKSAEGLRSDEKFRLITGLLSGFITVGGMSFKIMHMPGANLMLVIGVAIFVLVFLPSLFFSMYKNSVA
jgi:hypothetical protein